MAKSNKTKLFNELVGLKMCDIFLLPMAGIISDENMFVLNFAGQGKSFSLHVFSFLRVLIGNRMILSSSDEFFDVNYNQTNETFHGKFSDSSLLKQRMTNLKSLLKNEIVTGVICHNCGDVSIKFSNKVLIQLVIDCHCNRYDYYWLLDMKHENVSSVTFFEKGEVRSKTNLFQ